ncbi:uncharacterized protein L201_003303 [Kwoniella dendrophila CBS 6074]|uniref:Uncharacterized protein n=1 Tax=Kwoniella dendrophila CBS 6074 TaxID=1295534 RepID=A0AAX4JUZ7_9TREE
MSPSMLQFPKPEFSEPTSSDDCMETPSSTESETDESPRINYTRGVKLPKDENNNNNTICVLATWTCENQFQAKFKWTSSYPSLTNNDNGNGSNRNRYTTIDATVNDMPSYVYDQVELDGSFEESLLNSGSDISQCPKTESRNSRWSIQPVSLILFDTNGIDGRSEQVETIDGLVMDLEVQSNLP